MAGEAQISIGQLKGTLYQYMCTASKMGEFLCHNSIWRWLES